MANEAEIIASNILSSAIEYKRLYDTTKNNEYKVKEQRLRRIAENVKLLLSSSSTSSVNSFNGRTGAVVLTSADVTGALGYTPPTNLNGLTDVTISAPANAQVLTYNSTTSQWENQTPAGGGGGGDMLKATYDTDNSGIVDKAEALTTLGRNSTGATLYEGTIVRIEGSTGNRPNFVKAQANNDANSAQTFGVVMTDIANNSDGYVLVQGTLHDLDTRTGAGGATHPFTDVTLVDGDLLFLHPTIAGYVTNIKPSAPQHLVYVGVVTRTSPTNGTIVYRIQNGYELYELHDVAIASEVNNDLLVYESSTDLWKNKSISTIFGGTPLVSVPTLAQVTTAGNTTTNAITVGGLTVGQVGGSGTISFPTTTSGFAASIFTQYASNSLNLRVSNTYVKVYGSGQIELTGSTTITGITGAAALVVQQGNAAWSPVADFNGSAGTALRVNTNGNILIGTTTDAGYKLDVNGIARVVTRIDAGTFTPGAGASAYTFATTGTITAAGGYNLRSPIFGDSGFSGLADNSGPTIYANNAPVARFNNIGGALNGTSVDILQSYNPGAGTGNVVAVRHSYALYPTADNTVSYTSFSSTPYWNSAPFYNRITGTIRGFYFANGLYNTQKLVDVIAFQSVGGRVIFEGELPSASAGISRGVYINQTHTAAANNDVLVGLDINPTFTNGAFTGVTNLGLRVQSRVLFNTNTASTNSILKLTDNTNGTAWLGFSSTTATGFFIGGNGGMTLGKITADNSNPSAVHSQIVLNQIGNPGIQLSTNVANTGIVFSDGVNATIRMNFPSTGEAAITTISAHNLSIGVAASTGSLSSTTMKFFQSTGNVTINSTTDAGYKLDVNGTARVGNDFTIDNNRYLKAYRWTNASTSLPLQLESNSAYNVTGINFISYNNNLLNNTKNLFTFGLVSPITTQSSGSVDVANVINIVPEINFTFGTHTVRGIYYNPTLTSVTGTTHRAIETTSGDVIINTQSASANAGYTTMAIGGSSGVYLQMYVGTNPTAQTLRGQIWAVGNNLLFNNPGAGYLGLYTTLYSGITIWPTTGNVYVGASPSTDTGYKLDVNGTARVSGSLLFGAAGSYLYGDTNNIRLYDKNNMIILQSFPNGVASSETYLQSSSGSRFLRIREDYMGLEWHNSNVSSVTENPIRVVRGFFGNVAATNKSVLLVQSTSFSNLSNATTLRGIYIDINDTTTYTGFTTVRAIEAPRGGAYFNTTSPNASAILQVDSTTQGFLQPRMTNGQVLAITTPATGLQAYDTTNNKNLLYNGTAWQNVATESWVSAQGYLTSQPWVVSGSNIYYNTGNVGIGTTTPTDKLHIVDNTNGNKFARISAGGTDASAAWVAQNDQVDNVVYRVFGSAVTGSQMGISLARSASLLANLGGSGKFLIGTFSSSINNIAGYTGLLMIPGNPPGMQNVDIQGGIIVNVF